MISSICFYVRRPHALLTSCQDSSEFSLILKKFSCTAVLITTAFYMRVLAIIFLLSKNKLQKDSVHKKVLHLMDSFKLSIHSITFGGNTCISHSSSWCCQPQMKIVSDLRRFVTINFKLVKTSAAAARQCNCFEIDIYLIILYLGLYTLGNCVYILSYSHFLEVDSFSSQNFVYFVYIVLIYLVAVDISNG